VPEGASARQRVKAAERLIVENVGPTLLGNFPAIMGPGLGAFGLASSILREIATPDELQTVLRSLPHNVTTEMDLALWDLAQAIRADDAASHLLLTTPLAQVAQAYHAHTLPAVLQKGLEDFLQQYGHRGVAEIDTGLPRWSEDPVHILGVLVNYLQLENPDLAPDVQFKRGEREAEAMVRELSQRARQRLGWLRGRQVSYLLRQARELGGLRELPKFYLVLLMAGARRLLWPVGAELVEAGRLDTAEDIFFLYFTDIYRALEGEDFREIVRQRHQRYEQEMKRRHIPRILLSDGTEPEAELARASAASEHELAGTPASTGLVTAKARVITDPIGARLEPGEILVAPSTDPGWTPLFLTAGGLVMEMGGPMSHGSVVAREYGIPAVVGVHGAIERIATGQLITVNGSSGLIDLAPAADKAGA
jgi:pyruvate,water dikinase